MLEISKSDCCCRGSIIDHPAPEGTLGQKKRPRPVSYLFGKVLMSIFRKFYFRNIWSRSFWLNGIFVFFFGGFLLSPTFLCILWFYFVVFGQFLGSAGVGDEHKSILIFFTLSVFALFCIFARFFWHFLVLVHIWAFWECWRIMM